MIFRYTHTLHHNIYITNQIEDVVMGASMRKSSKSRSGLGLENPPHHLGFQTNKLVEITIQIIHKYPEVNVYNLFAKSQPKGLNEYLVCKFTQSIHISGGIKSKHSWKLNLELVYSSIWLKFLRAATQTQIVLQRAIKRVLEPLAASSECGRRIVLDFQF